MMMNSPLSPSLPWSLSSSSLSLKLQLRLYHLLITLFLYITNYVIIVDGWSSSVHSSSLWSHSTSPHLPPSIDLCTQQQQKLRRPFNDVFCSIFGGNGKVASFAFSLAAAAGNNMNNPQLSSSSPRSSDNNDHEKEKYDDGKPTMKKSSSSCDRLEWNIPNILETTCSFGSNREMIMADHRSWLLEDIYRATQRAAAYQQQQRQREATRSTTTKTTAMSKDAMRATIPLTNPELEKARLFLTVTSNNDNDDDNNDHLSYHHHHHGNFGIGEDYFEEENDDYNKRSSRYVASLPANVVFAMDRPLTYLREVLAYSSSSSSSSTLSGSNNRSRRRKKKQKREEIVIFCPGPHTTPTEAMKQRKYLSQVMDGMEVVLLHVGTHAGRHRMSTMDGEEKEKKGTEKEGEGEGEGVRIKITGDNIRVLKDLNLCTTTNCDIGSGSDGDGWYHVTYHGMDLLRAAVSWNPRGCDNNDPPPFPRSTTRSDWRMDPNTSSLEGGNDDQQLGEDDENGMETDNGDRLIDTLVQLIDAAVRNEFHHRHPFSSSTIMDDNDDEDDNNEEPHLVLLCYSATSRAIATAISRWLDFATSSSSTPISTLCSYSTTTKATVRGLSPFQARELLHRAVTVMTVAGVGVVLNEDDDNNNDNDNGDGGRDDGDDGEWRGLYPVGPAYLHVGMYDDPLFVGSSSPFSSNKSSSKLSPKSALPWYPSGDQRGGNTPTTTRGGGGVMVMDKTKQEERNDGDDDDDSGGDVVVLRTFSPYYLDSNFSSFGDEDDNDDHGSPTNTNNNQNNLLYHPAHNPSASLIQFLSLTLRKNGLEVRRSSSSNFRTLYEEGRKPTPREDITSYFGPPYYMHKVGELDLPSSEDDLLAAMIYVTGGERWLWGEVGEEEKRRWRRMTKMMTTMDDGTAEGIITEHFGYGVYDEIVEVCKVGSVVPW